MKNVKHTTAAAPAVNPQRRFLATGAAALAVAWTWSMPAAMAAELAEVRVGVNNVVSDAPFFIANK